MIYKAHFEEEENRIQTIKEHSENTAALCEDFAIHSLKRIAKAVGMLHDVGKYQQSFQERINGKNIRIPHALCGAIAAKEEYKNEAIAAILGYCIGGHHAGIPDAGSLCSTDYTLYGMLNRETEDFSQYKNELDIPDIDAQELFKYLISDCNNDPCMLVDKTAFIIRYIYSCLVDADSIDTAQFYGVDCQNPLFANFEKCSEKVNSHLQALSKNSQTPLQLARQRLQNQAYEKCNADGNIFLLNMPTGSGKTLCSIKWALERAIARNKKRIIYIIPYNSIIEQTAAQLNSIFGDSAAILRHQSSFDYNEDAGFSDEEITIYTLSKENWNAQLIITTAVQFFESIYSNKRSKLRKLHNMGDSLLVFDEAHLMPVDFLQPCIQSICYITKYLDSDALFLTATMPDYKALINKYAPISVDTIELIYDKSDFSIFDKCEYINLYSLSEEELINHTFLQPSALIIVNSKKKARALYTLCRSKNKYHLSTYMTANDRKRVIDEIRLELKRLQNDFPNMENIPEDRRLCVFSTSLIEAGVDLDFFAVYRELTGVDSILQAGGRCNREGKRAVGNVYIFELSESKSKKYHDERAPVTKGLLNEYDSISSPECIKEYFSRVYLFREQDITKNTMHNKTKDIKAIPFKEYSESFEIISSNTVSLIVPTDDICKAIIEESKLKGYIPYRKLQSYICSIYPYELDELKKLNAVEDLGGGTYYLKTMLYYDETGISFQSKDYFI